MQQTIGTGFADGAFSNPAQGRQCTDKDLDLDLSWFDTGSVVCHSCHQMIDTMGPFRLQLQKERMRR
jgi:hypothetical protein